MNAPVFPSNPYIGQQWMQWAWNGARWVCTPMSGVQIIQTVFTASGPYQPSPGLVTVQVECVGGGGGGGGALGEVPPGAGSGGFMMGGGGGGGGAYSRSALPASLVLGGVNVTIGAGGAAGSSTLATGENGSPTSFGTLVVANGGFAGTSAIAGLQFGPGGGRAAVGVGQLAAPGSGGLAGVGFYVNPGITGGNALGGAGGGSFFGSAGTTVPVSAGGAANGADGVFGAGGDGGASGGVDWPALGGVGGPGLCVVTEYCWSDVADEDCGCGSSSGMARVARYGQGGQWGFDP
jgi:hypothetical protein